MSSSSSSEDSASFVRPHCSSGLPPARPSRQMATLNKKKKAKAADENAARCKVCLDDARDLEIDLMLLEGPGPGGLRAHYHCLLFSSGLHQKGDEDEGLKGFLPEDIRREIRRGNRLKCVYCKKKGATVGCAKAQCKKSYHLPCGLRNKSLQQHFDQFKSFCSSHRPVQRVSAAKIGGSQGKKACAICLKDVEAKPSYGVLWAPCCSRWLHRSCLQKQALTAGSYHFRCPLCNNNTTFNKEMLQLGLFVPQQDAMWEQEGQLNSQFAVPKIAKICSAKICMCEKLEGREYNSVDSLWEILSCHACGSKGIHVTCGGLDEFIDPDWYCYTCRRVVRSNEPKLKPLKTTWGVAKGTKNGQELRSHASQKEELFKFSRKVSLKLVDSEPTKASVISNPSTTFQLEVKVEHLPDPADRMNVTLEDLIVTGLDRQTDLNLHRKRCAEEKMEASPGDSDYESAQEAQCKSGNSIPIKLKKSNPEQPLEVSAPETFNDKIQKTIKEFFHGNDQVPS